jgi:hypothetical protein
MEMSRSVCVYMAWWSPCLTLDRFRVSRRVSRHPQKNGCIYFLREDMKQKEEPAE